jgi:hypothetical protein
VLLKRTARRFIVKKSCIAILGAAFALGFIANGRDARAQSIPRAVQIVPAQAGTCSADLRDGVPYDDHEKHPDASCKLKIAQHNKSAWMRRLTSAVGADKLLAEAHVKQWEHAIGVASVAAMEKEYNDAKHALSKATGDAKRAAEAVVASAEKRLHDAIDSHEKDIERHAAEIKTQLMGIENNAKKRVDDMKKKFEGAVGDAKHAFQLEMLHAEQTLHRVEEVLATNELTAAERKLAAVGKRVSGEVAALRARAQAEYNQIKSKVDAIHKRVHNAIADVTAKIKSVESKVKGTVHAVTDEVSHVEHALKNVFHGLFG